MDCLTGLAATCSAAAVTRRLRSSSPRRAALKVSVVIEPVVNMEQMQLLAKEAFAMNAFISSAYAIKSVVVSVVVNL